jgi:RimJ/RimL family protein N-acetyltransferase
VRTWQYDAPYELYNAEPDEVEAGADTLVDPANRYFSVRDERGNLIAFICFGAEARVSGGDYSDDALDVGCGIRPGLTGQKLGPSIIDAAVTFAAERYGVTRFRATIAAFNKRAQRASQKAGFEPVSSFTRPSDGREFVILEREL